MRTTCSITLSLNLIVSALVIVMGLSSCASQRAALSDGPVPKKSKKVVNARLAGTSPKVWFVRPTADGVLQQVACDRSDLKEATGSDAVTQAVKQSVEELLKGPSAQEAESGLGSEIPKGTVLIGVATDADGNIVIDLSKRFVTGGGISSFEARMEQLRQTADLAAGGRKVFLNVEGQRLVQATGEGIEVKQPIN